MTYLVDTNILSELRRKNRDKHVEAWFRSISPDELFLSVVTIGEIENGIVKRERVNPSFANDLKNWLDGVLLHYGDRVLPFSTQIARRWGRLCGELGRTDADIMIAATALEYGLVIATRNVSHFKSTGADIINPYR